jgi:hypothetical protein
MFSPQFAAIARRRRAAVGFSPVGVNFDAATGFHRDTGFTATSNKNMLFSGWCKYDAAGDASPQVFFQGNSNRGG